MFNKEALEASLTHLVVRTERGNALIRQDPRQLPRRLRVLLLGIDGGQNVELYIKTLKGFGDVGDLLVELINLRLVELVSMQDTHKLPVRSSEYAELDLLLEDEGHFGRSAEDVLYGSTNTGSFDEMLRMAKIEIPDFVPPPPPPPPVPIAPEKQKLQIESLFQLLESVRGERRKLKSRAAMAERLREKVLQLENQNERLTQIVYLVASLGAALCVVFALFLIRG